MEQTVNDIIMNREAAEGLMPGEATDVAEERRLRKQTRDLDRVLASTEAGV